MKLLNAIVVIFVAIVLLVMAVGWRDCRAQGGHYVRGLFSMECIR